MGFTTGRLVVSAVAYLILTLVLLAAPTLSAGLNPTFTLYPESNANDPFPTILVYPGRSANFMLTLASINGFAGIVSMSVANVTRSQEVSFSIAPDTVMLTAGAYDRITVTGTAPETALFNGGVLQVNATDGSITQWVKMFFSVRESMKLTYASPLSVGAGSSSMTSLQMVTNGFSAQVNMTVSSPQGLTASLSRESLSITPTLRLSTFNLTVSASSTIAPARYNVNVTALAYNMVIVTDATTGVVISRTPKTISTQTLSVPIDVRRETQPLSILGISAPMLYWIIGTLLAATTSITIFLLRKRAANKIYSTGTSELSSISSLSMFA